MINVLDNPVYHALLTGNATLALGDGNVKYFDSRVSPFAGFDEGNAQGFLALHNQLATGRKILFATRKEIDEPAGWMLRVMVPGTQFVYPATTGFSNDYENITRLTENHVAEMVNLARLTKPGPFDVHTIKFGAYHGIFAGGNLVAMSGRRLHAGEYIEVSAVCTHPDFLGRGYAGKLIEQQVNSILAEGKIPYLHVRSDNERAIGLYERLDFVQNGNMNFYFLENTRAQIH